MDEEGEEPQRHLVRPLEVLEHDRERRARGRVEDEPCERLEELENVLRVDGRRRLGRELGEETRRLRAPRRRERRERGVVGRQAGAAQGFDPRTERLDPFRVVAAADDDPAARGRRHRRELANEPRLADAGVTEDRDDTRRGAREGVLEAPQLDVASDQRRLHRVALAERELGHALRGALADECPVKLARLGVGLDLELPLEHAHAELVLAQRRRVVAPARVQPHERAMRRLVERIEGEDAPPDLERARDVARVRVPREHARERAAHEAAQTLPLGGHPLLEPGLVEREPVEEIAAVELDPALERVRRPGREAALEARDVGADGGGRQRDGVAPDLEIGGGAVRERAADQEERLPQAVARVAVVDVAPEEGRQLFARVRLAQRDREIREQRLGLALGQHDGRPLVTDARLEPAQHRDRQRNGRRFPVPHFGGEPSTRDP